MAAKGPERDDAGAALTELAKLLGDEPPASLAGADPAALAQLTEAIRAAHDHQVTELRAATDRSFDHIPRLLRGPVRKLLGGRR